MNSNHSAAAIRSNANSSNGAPRTVQFYYVTFNYICFTILNKLLYCSFFHHCPFCWFVPLFDGIRKLSTVFHANLISKRKALTAHSGSRSNSCIKGRRSYVFATVNYCKVRLYKNLLCYLILTAIQTNLVFERL